MKRNILIVVFILILAVAADFAYVKFFKTVDEPVITDGDEQKTADEKEFGKIPMNDPKNTSYVINGTVYEVRDGFASQNISYGKDDGYSAGSFFKTIVNVEKGPFYGDVDMDGDNDAVVILGQDSGGSGYFYYAGVAILDVSSDGSKYYRGIEAYSIGDRIIVDSVEIIDGSITIKYKDRYPNDPMVAEPVLNKTLKVVLKSWGLVGYVVENKDSLIKVQSPSPLSVINSPLKVTGDARGKWYFEASFPVYLVDWDGRIIAEGVAQAQDEWMTEDYVPFVAELSFTKPDTTYDYAKRGTLILKKDNPSGLPEHDDAVEIPILFSE